MIQNTTFPDNVPSPIVDESTEEQRFYPNDPSDYLIEQALDYALKILQDRAKDPDRSNDSRCSYESAASILEYARCGDMEALAQFDY